MSRKLALKETADALPMSRFLLAGKIGGLAPGDALFVPGSEILARVKNIAGRRVTADRKFRTRRHISGTAMGVLVECLSKPSAGVKVERVA